MVFVILRGLSFSARAFGDWSMRLPIHSNLSSPLSSSSVLALIGAQVLVHLFDLARSQSTHFICHRRLLLFLFHYLVICCCSAPSIVFLLPSLSLPLSLSLASACAGCVVTALPVVTSPLLLREGAPCTGPRWPLPHPLPF